MIKHQLNFGLKLFGNEAAEPSAPGGRCGINDAAEGSATYCAVPGARSKDFGVAEPSLALTLPKQPTELDDGLLTASEVPHLKLNADCVVLSACYTAAADTPGDFCLDHPGARYEPGKNGFRCLSRCLMLDSNAI